jgi:pyruvate ferredoxin oxidoreductase gamma subunit
MEITIYGRGGQGAVKAAQLLAIAAFLSGYEAQTFPMFGIERRGAPVECFVRVDKNPIRTRTQIRKADYAIVLDATLLKAKKINGKKILVNSRKKISPYRTFDASSIALKIFPQAVNTAMIAALAFSTNLFTKESLLKACQELFEGDALQKNSEVIERVYSSFKK